MIVADILRYKGSDVYSIAASLTVQKIAMAFAELKISSAVIVDGNGDPVGIVTDRGIILALTTYGPNALSKPAAQIMETPLPTCAPDDKVRHVMQVMTEKRARHLVVRADDETLGLISIGDVVKYHIRDTELENKVLRDMATARLAS